VRHVGIAAVTVAGLIRADHRRNWKSAPRAEDAVPLPVADQLFDPSGGSFAESPAIPYRQSVAEAAAELVLGVIGPEPSVQFAIVRIQDRRRIILRGSSEDSRIEIDHFRERVIGSERQSALGPLGQRNAPSMVVCGA